jgi:hypothetical protein
LEYPEQEYKEAPIKIPKLDFDDDEDSSPSRRREGNRNRRGKKSLPEQLVATGDHLCDDIWIEITQILDAETQQRLAMSSVRTMDLADQVRMRRARHDDIRIEGLSSANWYLIYYTELFVPPQRLSLRLELRPECADEPEFNMVNASTVIERFSNLGTNITHILVDGRDHKSPYELLQCGESDIPDQIDQHGNLHPDFEEMLLYPAEWVSRKCISPGFIGALQKLHHSLVELHLINIGIAAHVLDDLIMLPPSQIASADARCSGIFTNSCFTSLVLERLLTEDDVAGVVGGRVNLASVDDIMERCPGFAQLQKLGLNYNCIAISQETLVRAFTLPNLWSLSLRHSNMENDTLDFTEALVTDKLYELNVDNTSARQLINLNKFNNLHNISAHRIHRDLLRMLRAQAKQLHFEAHCPP